MNAPRLRFAPSPTGYLHVGGARTALFSWLLARHHRGCFVLRIEDTDRTRSTAQYSAAILDALRWLGLDWDEGPETGGPHEPYCQMERLARYQEAAERLLHAGRAYRCFCQAKTDDPDHGEKCRCGTLAPPGDAGTEAGATRTGTEAGAARTGTEAGATRTGPGAIRFRTPGEGQTVFQDLIHGAMSFDNAELDDFIILKADGVPTYNFAVVVDDAEMEITHVLRGDDHLSNTPRQVLLFAALALDPPRFGHVPMILGPDKKRLSKRHGAVSIQAFREDGYLPEALVNYLARLGWAHGDQEIFTTAELIASFDLEGVGKSAAVFDYAKLEWLNGDWIRRLGAEEITRRVRPYFEARGLIGAGADEPRLPAIVGALLERAKTLVQMVDQAWYFFSDDLRWDEQARLELLTPAVRPVLEALARRFERLQDWTHEAIEAAFRAQAAEAGLKAGQVIQPVRVALTGGKASPGIFEVVELIGREKTLLRLQEATRGIGAPVASS